MAAGTARGAFRPLDDSRSSAGACPVPGYAREGVRGQQPSLPSNARQQADRIALIRDCKMTQRRFSAAASKHRSSRSEGRSARSPGSVVGGLFHLGADLLAGGHVPQFYRLMSFSAAMVLPSGLRATSEKSPLLPVKE